MKTLPAHPKLVELVQDAILAEIASGLLTPGQPVGTDRVARELGVTGAPVQRALEVLCDLGVLSSTAGGGLRVAPLEVEQVRNLYDVRSVMEGLAFRKAAERNSARAAAEGPAMLQAGRRAAAAGAVADMIEADMAFHDFIYALSENPLVAPAIERHWTQTHRVMGEALLRHQEPQRIWDQHEKMLQAVVDGDGALAEQLARSHIDQSASIIIERLQREAPPG